MEEREKAMSSRFPGNDPRIVGRRNKAIGRIIQFILPENTSPEEYVFNTLDRLTNYDATQIGIDTEILEAIHRAGHIEDKHQYVNNIIDELGYTREDGLLRIVEAMAKTSVWAEYTSEVREWLESWNKDMHGNRVVP
jgi:hypothetical protein